MKKVKVIIYCDGQKCGKNNRLVNGDGAKLINACGQKLKQG